MTCCVVEEGNDDPGSIALFSTFPPPASAG
jgi:hypothetical protein